jgi:acetyl-CoA carboxylase biotin carboxyl carrier protein
MPLSSREIKDILAILEESGWDEAEVTIDDVRIVVSKGNGRPSAGSPPAAPALPPAASEPVGAAAPAPTPALAAATPAPAAAPAELDGHLVRAPSVGVFWRSPEPGAAPFVEIGEKVSAGQTLCIVEVMKLMQHVTADVDGEITAIHVANSEHVEFDTPLFSIAAA